MNNYPFNIGDRVRHGDDQGFITFIDHQYFKLCVKEWEDKSTMRGVGQVNVLIYRHDWKNVKKL